MHSFRVLGFFLCALITLLLNPLYTHQFSIDASEKYLKETSSNRTPSYLLTHDTPQVKSDLPPSSYFDGLRSGKFSLALAWKTRNVWAGRITVGGNPFTGWSKIDFKYEISFPSLTFDSFILVLYDTGEKESSCPLGNSFA